MCFSQDDSKRNCLTNILDTILCLQEKKDSCCEEPYVSTNSFFTINLDCVSAIKCLADTFVSGV